MNTLQDVLNELYKHEINIKIESFYDSKWMITLGDDMNGFDNPIFCVETKDLAKEIKALAIEKFPSLKI